MNTSYIDKMLDFDPIAMAEKITGDKHWSEFDDSENAMSLGLAMVSGEAKKNALKQIGDTYLGMKWGEFKALIEDRGFKKALAYKFPYEDREEEAVIYYDSNGFVIWATSFYGNVNGGTVYGQIEAGSEFSRSDLNRCSNGAFADNKWYFSLDVREGVFHTLGRITSNAKPLKIWESGEFLWFVDFTEDKEPEYDYKAITENKIKSCPCELQDIVKVCVK